MTTDRWEKVHTVSLYWNGPLLGVADMDGAPHLYEKVFSEEEDGYLECYRVMPIDQQLHALLMERWSIFARWRMANPGRKLETHPALPEDGDRYSFLDQAIGNRDKPHSDRSRVVGAQFRRTSSGPSYVLAQWEVQWQEQAAAPGTLESARPGGRGLDAKDEDRDFADKDRNCKQCGHPAGPHVITAFDVTDFSQGGVMRCPADGCNCESTISFNPKLS
jgi:hypothetical protein